jgi:ketosteroid isomerase-like protein
MHPNEQLITRFYECFARRDASGMAACYAPDVHFSDEVFDLRGVHAANMWRMLLKSPDLRLTYSNVQADDLAGRAHWDAHYTFGASGRRVHNSIDAEFVFKDGLITRHRDRFDFWRWSRQALGPSGLLLGWTPLVRNKVRATAEARLHDFEQPEAKMV